MTAPQEESVDLSSDPQDLAGMLLATRRAYQTALVETANARKKLDADIKAARSSAEEQTKRFAPDPSLLDRLSSAWTSYGEPGAPQAASAEPASLEDAERAWAAAARRCLEELDRYQSSRDAWANRRKPIFKKAEPEPKLTHGFLQSLLTLQQVSEVYPGLRAAATEAQIAAATANLKGAFEADAAARDGQASHLIESNIASIRLGVELLGPTGEPWDRLLNSSAGPSAGPRGGARLGSIASGLPHPYTVEVPCVLDFPSRRGLAIESPASVRQQALELARSIMLRVLFDLPPGQLRLTMIDPTAIGQTFAEFVHLGDFDERLIDTGVKTSQQAIERSLAEHAAHLETVISRYLRGQFSSIHDYNLHAGEMAEAFRLLVIADYPRQFSERAREQLLSIAENGPRCGVYTLLLYDPGEDDPRGVPFARLTQSMDVVSWHGTTPRVRFADTGVTLEFIPDSCPPIAFDVDGAPASPAAQAIETLGLAAKRGTEATVTLDNFLPVINRNRAGALPDFHAGAPTLTLDPSSWWTASTADMAVSPIGRSGAQGVASMYFSSTAVAGGAIMVGLPRSGKTTTLHAMILTLSMLYSPDELELYLIDAKHGVEFKVYETLPHARMVSIHSEREFSLAVLKSIQAKIRERAELIKAVGSGLSNITEYRRVTGKALPRIVVVIDEFHEIFEEPDSIGMEAFAAFSDIVRMGPFSGIHIVVASQTLSSMPAMDRQTLTLLPQRIAFMCNDYDAEIVMGDTNKAARMLSKTGEGLFNPARGDESKNQPFQGLYVNPDARGLLLRELRDKADREGLTRHPRVFDGDAVVPRPAASSQSSTSARLTVPVGEPFTLADSETIVLPRARGANVLLLGDRSDEEGADLAVRGALHSFLLAARSQSASATVVDCIGDELLPQGLTIMDVAHAVDARYVRSRSLEPVVREVAATVATRMQTEDYRAPTQLLILVGLQRALSLTPFDPYTSSESDEPTLPQLLAAIVTNGPEVGIHVIVDTDRGRTAEMRLGEELLGEFTLRVAGSAADAKDLEFATGSYGEVAAPRAGQLLICDRLRGSVKRVRGYEILTTPPAAS